MRISLIKEQSSVGSQTLSATQKLAVRRLQQSQLDSLQAQIRELAQQLTEFSEQMTEVANAVTDMFHQLGVLRSTFNQAMNDMFRHLKVPSSCLQRNWLLHNQIMCKFHRNTSDLSPEALMKKEHRRVNWHHALILLVFLFSVLGSSVASLLTT